MREEKEKHTARLLGQLPLTDKAAPPAIHNDSKMLKGVDYASGLPVTLLAKERCRKVERPSKVVAKSNSAFRLFDRKGRG